MSFDTLYRPRKFADVVGQAATISTLKRLLERGDACQSSYIFAGLSGAGKTTLARIFARAILCEDLQPDQEPCNACGSCTAILDQASTDMFIELDAANNSGADTVRSIIESLAYSTFGGQSRRIYLFDEAHRLSTQAQDALLKPMEDCVEGSKDRRMVCFLCTTELDKIRTAIRSRSHTFKIQEPTTEEIRTRLAFICADQNLEFEVPALDLIIEQGRGHIRDMVRSVERVAQVHGKLSLEGVRDVLGLDVVPLYFQIIGDASQSDKSDQANRMAYDKARKALETVSAQKVAQGLLWAAIETYRVKAYGLSTSYADETDALYERLNHNTPTLLSLCRKLEGLQKIFQTLENEYALLYIISMMFVEDTVSYIPVSGGSTSMTHNITSPADLLHQTKVFGNPSNGEPVTVVSASGKFKSQPPVVTEKEMPYMRKNAKTEPVDLSAVAPASPTIPQVRSFVRKDSTEGG